MAANSWREMYEGVIKYNSLLGESRQLLERSTSRKKEIEMTVMEASKKEGYYGSESIKKMERSNAKFMEKLKGNSKKGEEEKTLREVKMPKSYRVFEY